MKRTLRVGFDLNPLKTQLKKKRGIGFATLRIAEELMTISTSLPFELIFYAQEDETFNYYLPDANIRYIKDCTHLPEILKCDNINLFHFNDYFFPLYNPEDFINEKFSFLSTLITVYDMFPLQYKTNNNQLFTRNLLSIINHIDNITTISQDSEIQLINFAGISTNKITTILCGIDHTIFHSNYFPEEIKEIKKIYGLENDFILQVGAINKRKNQIFTLEAYKILLDNFTPFLDLVFVGGTVTTELQHYIDENKLTKRVKFLGLVPDKHLPLIYNAAKIFAYPSLNEGFGNPPLEAMACGIPVISSDRGSLPEVLGDCAEYINPLNKNELAKAILYLLTRSEKNITMVNNGLEHVKKYSWEKTVNNLVKLYTNILF